MQATDAMIEVLHGRHNHGIDPALHIWGWEIPVYLFLGGLAAGLLILTALLEMRRGGPAPARSIRLMPFASLGLITLGMVALLVDLEMKEHFYRFYFSFEAASPMSWGSWILLVVYPAGILLGLGGLTEPERRGLLGATVLRPFRRIVAWAVGLSDRSRPAILWTAVLVGAALGTYTGLLLGTLGARPAWNTAILGPLFLLSGLSTGAALMLLARPGDEEQHILVRWDVALIAAELLFIFLMILDLSTGSRATQIGAGLFLGGPYTGAFWALVVIAGLLVPLALELAEVRSRSAPTLLAPALILIGGISLRWILMLAGQASSFGLIH